MKYPSRFTSILVAVLLVTTALSACTPADQPAESVPADTTTASTTASTTAPVTTPATVIPTEPVTTPTETTPITEEPETRVTEETFAVPEGASPMPDLNADNVFIIPTMEEVLEEFDDIQTESDTLEENLVKLMKRNVVCFDLYLTGWFTYKMDYQDFRDNGIAPVYSEYITSYAKLEQFMKSTYIDEEVNYRLDFGRFVNVDGQLYYGRYNEWPSNPFMNRSILEIVSVSENQVSCRYYIKDTDPNAPYYQDGIKQEVYIIKEFDVVKEDGTWKLPDIMFDNGLYIYRTSVYTDEIV